jgi:beta-glucanase (GH16 family)
VLRAPALLLVAGALACGPAPAQSDSPVPPTGPTPATDGQWKLVWSDEFDRDGMPDTTRWGYDVGYIANHEAQWYTKARPENARVENGHLVIEARKEKYAGAEYTSARLNTKGKESWRYGRVEVRAKIPAGRGMWPAIWMLGTNIDDVGWPACGEIDIMENVGFEPNVIHGTVHTRAFNGAQGTQKGSQTSVAGAADAFHVYAMEWFPDRISFFVDGQAYFTFANDHSGNADWPFDQPQFLVLNTAVGGDWGGQQGIDDGIFPQKFLIDYVRVYEASK